MSLNKPIVMYEPFAPIAELESRADKLAADNAALRLDQTELCNLLADKSGQLARLEQDAATLRCQLAEQQRLNAQLQLRIERMRIAASAAANLKRRPTTGRSTGRYVAQRNR